MNSSTWLTKAENVFSGLLEHHLETLEDEMAAGIEWIKRCDKQSLISGGEQGDIGAPADGTVPTPMRRRRGRPRKSTYDLSTTEMSLATPKTQAVPSMFPASAIKSGSLVCHDKVDPLLTFN